MLCAPLHGDDLRLGPSPTTASLDRGWHCSSRRLPTCGWVGGCGDGPRASVPAPLYISILNKTESSQATDLRLRLDSHSSNIEPEWPTSLTAVPPTRSYRDLSTHLSTEWCWLALPALASSRCSDTSTADDGATLASPTTSGTIVDALTLRTPHGRRQPREEIHLLRIC